MIVWPHSHREKEYHNLAIHFGAFVSLMLKPEGELLKAAGNIEGEWLKPRNY